MTDFERRIKTRMIEDEYAEKFHQLDMEESIAHINRDTTQLCRINEKECSLKQRWKLKRTF